MKLIKVLGTAILISVTTACGNTADGVKKDADAAADKTAEAAASTGTAVGGALETGQVKAAILADTRVNASGINVDTDEQKKTVTLKGTVPTEAEKTIAGDIATQKATGYTVVNSLTIKP
jgi:osmotically-inducible protein OsmY